MDLKPLFVWSGGKRKVIPEYRERNILPKSFQRHLAYVEPFFGGGALFCDVVNSGFKGELVINDQNRELMYVYYWIREEPKRFIHECQELLKLRNSLVITKTPPKGNNDVKTPRKNRIKTPRQVWFYNLRDQYWTGPSLIENYESLNPDTLQPAAMLYVMMLTGYSIWQVVMDKKSPNKGKANLTCGPEKNRNLDVDLILEWSTVLKRTRLYCGSYADVDIPPRSFIFIDPPYRNSKVTYGDPLVNTAQTKLFEWCIEKSIQNHMIVFANREVFDRFFRKLILKKDRKKEDTYKYFFVGGTIGTELVVKLEPESIKRSTFTTDTGKIMKVANVLPYLLRDHIKYLDDGGQELDFETLLKTYKIPPQPVPKPQKLRKKKP